MIIPNFGPLPKLFLSSPTELHPLSDFLYSPTLQILRYGHGWSLSLFPNVTSLTIGLVGLCYMGHDSWFDWWFVTVCVSVFLVESHYGTLFSTFLSSSLLHNIYL